MRARDKGSSPGRVEGSSRAMLSTARPFCLVTGYCRCAASSEDKTQGKVIYSSIYSLIDRRECVRRSDGSTRSLIQRFVDKHTSRPSDSQSLWAVYRGSSQLSAEDDCSSTVQYRSHAIADHMVPRTRGVSSTAKLGWPVGAGVTGKFFFGHMLKYRAL